MRIPDGTSRCPVKQQRQCLLLQLLEEEALPLNGNDGCWNGAAGEDELLALTLHRATVYNRTRAAGWSTLIGIIAPRRSVPSDGLVMSRAPVSHERRRHAWLPSSAAAGFACARSYPPASWWLHL